MMTPVEATFLNHLKSHIWS